MHVRVPCAHLVLLVLAAFVIRVGYYVTFHPSHISHLLMSYETHVLTCDEVNRLLDKQFWLGTASVILSYRKSSRVSFPGLKTKNCQ